MKTEDTENITDSSWTCIYMGKNTSYTDTDLTLMNRYVYRLDKKRGGKLFKGIKYGFGVCSDTNKDENEFNDSKENAKCLDVDFVGNLPCVRYINDENYHLDEDWYYVDVPPARKAKITITQQGDLAANSETNMMVLQPSHNPEIVKQNVGIFLNNSTTKVERKYFKIYPNTTELFSSSTSFYTTIAYTVKLIEITKYN